MKRAELEALGRSLRRINPSLLRKPADVSTRIWYQGGEPYFDVFVDLKAGEIDWFQVTLRGRFLCWRRDGTGWQTGTTNELQTEVQVLYPASKTVTLDDTLDGQFVHCVQSLLATRADDPLLGRLAAFCTQAYLQVS
ncbi:MAG: hypothetical protein HC838_08055 [Spirulinaceae cyanobacterium RM2_2_10]|nr:hypothetical protein [Spirulinaceae cyanobacterium SM2_1_0]NJO20009.1 hypothetical protein [Spirulinaceae cyanobacterium RM2_2_10]